MLGTKTPCSHSLNREIVSACRLLSAHQVGWSDKVIISLLIEKDALYHAGVETKIPQL